MPLFRNEKFCLLNPGMLIFFQIQRKNYLEYCCSDENHLSNQFHFLFLFVLKIFPLKNVHNMCLKE